MSFAEVGRLLLALGLPWLLGGLWAHTVLAGRRAWNVPVVLGYGFPLGMLAVMALMLLWEALGLPQNFWRTIVALGALATISALVILPIFRRGQMRAPLAAWRALTPAWKWICGLLLAWIALRMGGLLAEVLWRPLFPWDAWFYYAPRAKVWFEYGHLIEFVSGRQWREATDLAFTAGSGRHPDGIPLMQYWTLQSVGRFDDALMNLPWFAAAIATALALFGLARAAGASLPVSLIAVYVLVSLPIFDTHVALAGYGDLWIGLFVLMAAGSLFLATGDRDWRPLWFILPVIVGLLMIKQSGMLWVGALVAGMLFGWLRLRWALLVIALPAVCALLIGLVVGVEFEIRRLGVFAIGPEGIVLPGYSPVLPEFAALLFGMASWHLLWYIVPLVLIAALFIARRSMAVRALSVMVLSGLGVLAFFFLFTEASEWVVAGTNINRSLLHVTSALILLGAITLNDRLEGWPGHPVRVLAILVPAGLLLWAGFGLWAVNGLHFSMPFGELQARVFGEWLAWRPWNTPSINRTLVADGERLISPAVAVACWIALAAALLLVWSGAKQFARGGVRLKALAPALLIMVAAGWAVLDLRWQGDLLYRLADTGKLFAGKDWYQRRAADFDGPEFEFMERLKSRIDDPKARLWIYSATELYHYRIRYHALPQPAYASDSAPSNNQWRHFRRGDYVILLDAEVLRPGNIQRPHGLSRHDHSERFTLAESAGSDATLRRGEHGQELVMNNTGNELMQISGHFAPPSGFYTLRARLRRQREGSKVSFRIYHVPPEGEERLIAARDFKVEGAGYQDYALPFMVPGAGRLEYRVLADDAPGLSASALGIVRMPAQETLAFLAAGRDGPFLVVRPLLQSASAKAMVFEVQ